MKKNIIFDSWNYLDNPAEGLETWECERNLLTDFFKDHAVDGQVIMQGTVGRWDGTYAAGKTGIFELLLSQLMQYADDVEIYDEGGHLFIHTTDHDGSSLFEVKILTEKALDSLENYRYDEGRWRNLSEREVHDKLMQDSHYTRLPHYAKWLGLKAA